MSATGREIIVRVLLAFDVRFVVVGGVAAQVRGWTETTLDIDLVPDRDPENLGRLARALNDLDVRWRVAGAPDGHPLAGPLDAATIVRHASLAFICEHGPVDVVLHPDGVDGFAELELTATVEQLAARLSWSPARPTSCAPSGLLIV